MAFNFTEDLDPEMLAAEISKSCEVRLSTVKGKQIFPRAELTATISATQHHPMAPSFTDAAYVADGCSREPPPDTFYNVPPNADLWRQWHALGHTAGCTRSKRTDASARSLIKR